MTIQSKELADEIEKQKVELIYVDSAIANRFGNQIELHKDLINYPDLHNRILEHELGHTFDKSIKEDLKHDLDSHVKFGEMFNFMVKNPKATLQFLPFYWTRKRGFVYDINLTMIYIFVIAMLGGASFLIWKFI